RSPRGPRADYLHGWCSSTCDRLYLVPAALGSYFTPSIGDGLVSYYRLPSLRIGNWKMSEAAVMPHGNAVAEVSGMVRTDGRNRRAAETRRKIIEAAKAMIDETSEAPTVVGVA